MFNGCLDEFKIETRKPNCRTIDFWIKNNDINWKDRIKHKLNKVIPFIKFRKNELKGLEIELPLEGKENFSIKMKDEIIIKGDLS